MKKLAFAFLTVTSLSAFAGAPAFQNLEKNELEKIGNEFAVNFSHNPVAAPETDGLWGVEVGLVAGRTASPKVKKMVDDAGEDGSDFKNLYTAGLMARVHVPFDIFVEATVLPEREISDVDVSNRTLGAGWNVGSFLGLPLDVAVGASASASEISFKQMISGVQGTIDMDSKTRILWAGVSKTFLFVTPYIKVGTARSETELSVTSTTGTIFSDPTLKKEDVSSTGGYLAFGANLQLAFFKFGIEASQTIGVKRAAAKFSLDF